MIFDFFHSARCANLHVLVQPSLTPFCLLAKSCFFIMILAHPSLGWCFHLYCLGENSWQVFTLPQVIIAPAYKCQFAPSLKCDMFKTEFLISPLSTSTVGHHILILPSHAARSSLQLHCYTELFPDLRASPQLLLHTFPLAVAFAYSNLPSLLLSG